MERLRKGYECGICMCVCAVCVILGWQTSTDEPNQRCNGKIRFRSGLMAHSVILSSAHFLTSCFLTLLRLPGDPVVCGPVGFLSLVWPTGKCQQSMSPLSTPMYLALHQAGWGLLHQRGDSGSEDLLSLQWSSPSLPKHNDNTFPCPLRSVPHYFLWVFSQGDWQEALGWLFTSDILLILLKTFLKMMAFHVFRDQSGPLT